MSTSIQKSHTRIGLIGHRAIIQNSGRTATIEDLTFPDNYPSYRRVGVRHTCHICTIHTVSQILHMDVKNVNQCSRNVCWTRVEKYVL